jgi:predicted dehydrogenase
MARVKIVGAGQLGSRHLQALQSVSKPLEIHVIDPSPESLRVAQERFEAVGMSVGHRVRYETGVTASGPTDVAIVATNANTRRKAVEALLAASPVEALVLEKLLFDRRDDYAVVQRLVEGSGARAWVNCCMRVMSPYEAIRIEIGGEPVSYRVTGSQYGLVTNAIHYVDHVVHLTGASQAFFDVSGIDARPIASKRRGFLELTGTLAGRLSDGSRFEIACYPAGSAPVVVEIFSPSHRFVIRESEGRVWHSHESTGWKWLEREVRIPYQSEMTAGVVNSLLTTGECGLAPLAESVALHLSLLEALRPCVQAEAPEDGAYPFT